MAELSFFLFLVIIILLVWVLRKLSSFRHDLVSLRKEVEKAFHTVTPAENTAKAVQPEVVSPPQIEAVPAATTWDDERIVSMFETEKFYQEPVTPAGTVAEPPPPRPKEATVAATKAQSQDIMEKTVAKLGKIETHFIKKEDAQPSKFEEAALDVIGRIREWILVGEEYRNSGISVEAAVATTWMVRVAVLAILAGLAFGAKYSIDHGWISETVRVFSIAGIGVGMGAFGVSLIRTRYRVIGQGLLGGGFAALYFSVFAAKSLYGLIDGEWAFSLFAAITAPAVFVSVYYRSQLTILIALFGGLLAPLLFQGPAERSFLTVCYLLLLDCGMLWGARKCNWPLITFFTCLKTIGYWIFRFDWPGELECWQFLSAGAANFLLFTFSGFGYCLTTRKRFNALDTLLMILNTVFWVCWITFATKGYYGSGLASLIPLTVGCVFGAAIVLLIVLKRCEDKAMFYSCTALMAMSLAYSVPLALTASSMAAGWAILAAGLFYFALRVKTCFILRMSYIAFFIAFVRGVFWSCRDWAGAFQNLGFWHSVLNHTTNLGIVAAALGICFWLIRREKDRSWMGKEVKTSVAVFFWSTLGVLNLLGMIYAYAISIHTRTEFLPVMQIAILVGDLYFLRFCYRFSTKRQLLNVIIGVSALALLIVFCRDTFFWLKLGRLRSVWGVGDLALRVLEYGGLYAVFLNFWRFFKKTPYADRASMFPVVGSIFFFLYSTVEISGQLRLRLPEFAAGGVSLSWSLWALTLLAFGILLRSKTARFSGLGIFILTMGKIVLVDMHHSPVGAKIVVFIISGVVLLVGAFAYIRFQNWFDPMLRSVREKIKKE